MLPQSLLVLVSAMASVAVAHQDYNKHGQTSSCGSPPQHNGTSTYDPTSPYKLSRAVLPITGAALELPSPKNLTLKYITVGHGIQNYTCSAAGANATATGALAMLWDIGHLYPKSGRKALSWQKWNDLPRDILRTTNSPIKAVGTLENQFGTDKKTAFKRDSDLYIHGRKLKFLGHHTFDKNLVPTFDLFVTGALFKGGKLAGVKAPKSADVGPLGTGAVDWLELADGGKGLSKGLRINYRVITAGGAPTKCWAAGQEISVPYATMYWMYN